MASDIVLEVASRTAALLQSRGVDFALIGGLALQPWGRIRSTLDVDMVVFIPEANQPDFQDALVAAGFRLRTAAPVRLEHVSLLQSVLPHAASGLDIRVDFIFASSPFHRRILERKVTVAINDHAFPVASCEDLILLKLLGGRPIDRVDASELCQLNAADLDVAYLREQATALGISQELAECLN